jgi:hypothetical protein
MGHTNQKYEHVRVIQADGSYINTLGMTKPLELRVFDSNLAKNVEKNIA